MAEETVQSLEQIICTKSGSRKKDDAVSVPERPLAERKRIFAIVKRPKTLTLIWVVHERADLL